MPEKTTEMPANNYVKSIIFSINIIIVIIIIMERLRTSSLIHHSPRR